MRFDNKLLNYCTFWNTFRELTWIVIHGVITSVTFQPMTDWRVTTGWRGSLYEEFEKYLGIFQDCWWLLNALRNLSPATYVIFKFQFQAMPLLLHEANPGHHFYTTSLKVHSNIIFIHFHYKTSLDLDLDVCMYV